MPLRNPNNPNTASVVAVALVTVMLGYPTANTLAGLNSWPVYINKKAEMTTAASGTVFPAVLVEFDPNQSYTRVSRSTWEGSLTFSVEAYDRWDTQTNPIDTAFANLVAEVERWKANVESNESLAQNNTAYTITMHSSHLDGYEPTQVNADGLNLVKYRWRAGFWLLPYDS